jgi:hypothetical protein
VTTIEIAILATVGIFVAVVWITLIRASARGGG